MTSEIIVVKQIPEIVEQLNTIKGEIEQRVSEALALDCTEDTVKEVKAVRAALSKDFQELEARRKDVKKTILSPYEQFEVVYKSCVTDVYRPADRQLAEKIAEVENDLKNRKKSEIVEYFNELCTAKAIDFVSFEQTGAVVTLTASKKSLKEKVKAFIDKTSDDLAMIDTQEYAAEILVEYKRTLNVSQAIMTVTSRMKAIDDERKRAESARIAREQQISATQLIDNVVEAQVADDTPLSAPVVEPETREFILIPIKVDYPTGKYHELIQLCKEFKERLIERGFRIVK